MKDFGRLGSVVSLGGGTGDVGTTGAGFDVFQSTAIEQAEQGAANLNSIHPSFVLPAPADMQSEPGSVYAGYGKRLLDIVLVFLTLPFSLPIVALGAFLLWLEGGRPFYRQDRIGKDGQVFSILKLRTMVRDADARLASYLAADPDLRREWEETQKLKNDPRITTVGAVLRATSMDELPQLWNVLIGDMSLVGPRPMMTDQADLYGDSRFYNALRPGITGIWQVSDRNHSTFASRCVADELYFRSMSLGKDLILMFRTLGAVVRRTGY
jgi:lipopolysaccharide/colanic/teichoic acid biosynthesis glycosyltransferase